MAPLDRLDQRLARTEYFGATRTSVGGRAGEKRGRGAALKLKRSGLVTKGEFLQALEGTGGANGTGLGPRHWDHLFSALVAPGVRVSEGLERVPARLRPSFAACGPAASKRACPCALGPRKAKILIIRLRMSIMLALPASQSQPHGVRSRNMRDKQLEEEKEIDRPSYDDEGKMGDASDELSRSTSNWSVEESTWILGDSASRAPQQRVLRL